jgi:hypothetical protein
VKNLCLSWKRVPLCMQSNMSFEVQSLLASGFCCWVIHSLLLVRSLKADLPLLLCGE